MKTVYLCGGINGLTDDEASIWRDYATKLLEINEIPIFNKSNGKLKEIIKERSLFKCLNPLRQQFGVIGYQSPSEIISLDKNDILKSDILLVNAMKPSWGTAMEVLFAFERHKLIVAFTGDKFENSSPWLSFHVTRICKTMEEAIKYIKENF